MIIKNNEEKTDEKTFAVSVFAGNGISDVTGSGQYKAGDRVTVKATVKNNYVFRNWTGNNISGSTNSSYTFTMPKKDVTLTANATQAPMYTLTVVKGDDGISSVSGGGSYYAGESVTVTCKISTGYLSDEWYSSNVNAVANKSSQSYTFTMPSGNLTLTAKSTDNRYTVTLSKGTGISSVSGGGTYTAGDTVTVGCTPKSDYDFSEWTSSNTSKLKNSSVQSYSFTMPKETLIKSGCLERRAGFSAGEVEKSQK